MVDAGAPGAVVLLADDRGAHAVAAGLADVRSGRPMEPHLRFRAGSVTKPFIAALVLRLAADGRLTLADTVERWLPGILPYGEQVSVRQLLNHTGGVPNYPPSLWRTFYDSPDGRMRSWAPRDLVGLVADKPPVSRPGATWSYSNIGYILAGLIIEAATADGLEAQLSRLILEPLGLRDTSMPIGTGIPEPGARGYSPPLGPELDARDGPLIDVTEQDPSWAWTAGALVSTVSDVARFFRALLEGRLLPPELLDEMLTTVPVPSASLPLPVFDRYGLGIVGLDTSAGPLVGGPGGILGFLNMILSTPDGRRQLGVMVNVGDRAPAPVVDTFVGALREYGARIAAH
jgi:D-alanyl-D-alanine carboxypeptidase